MKSWSPSAGDTRSCSISRQRLIAEAVRRRAELAAAGDMTAYRVVHGEAEGTPGLVVAQYADVAVVHAEAASIVEDLFAVPDSARADGSADGCAKIHPRSM